MIICIIDQTSFLLYKYKFEGVIFTWIYFPDAMSVYTAQCQCRSTSIMSVYTAQCQCRSTGTMSVYIHKAYTNSWSGVMEWSGAVEWSGIFGAGFLESMQVI